MERVKKMSQKQRDEALKQIQLVSFVGELKKEFKKVSWTSKLELFAYTKMVILSTFLIGFAVYGVDLLIQGFLTLLSRII